MGFVSTDVTFELNDDMMSPPSSNHSFCPTHRHYLPADSPFSVIVYLLFSSPQRSTGGRGT